MSNIQTNKIQCVIEKGLENLTNFKKKMYLENSQLILIANMINMSGFLTSALAVLKSAPLSISTLTRSLLATRRASSTGVKPTCGINCSH